MKNLIIIETPEELIRFAQHNRVHNDKSPSLPSGAKLFFENDMLDVRLEAEGFMLAPEITANSVIASLARVAGLEIRFT